MTAWLVALTAALVAVLVWNQRRDAPGFDRMVKMAASTGLVSVALSVDATASTYGRLVLGAIALSWVGDLLLTFVDRGAFLGGLFAFLAAHIAYIAAFSVRGIDPAWLIVAGVLLVAVAAVVWRWLRPHVGDPFRRPVLVYTVVITAMVAAALGTTGLSLDARIPLGAAAFYLSDLAVARNRFVAPGSINRVVGLPLYYTGQVLLALSAGG